MSAEKSDAAGKRLQKELMEMMMDPPEGIWACPEDEDLFKWSATIQGVQGTTYEGLEYKLSVHFSNKYPHEAPQVKFVTPCFHPNVDQNGHICLDVLKESWSAVYTVIQVLLSVQSLLESANVDSPLNVQAASLWAKQDLFKQELHARYQEAVAAKAS
eukprot:gene624-11946_t